MQGPTCRCGQFTASAPDCTVNELRTWLNAVAIWNMSLKFSPEPVCHESMFWFVVSAKVNANIVTEPTCHESMFWLNFFVCSETCLACPQRRLSATN